MFEEHPAFVCPSEDTVLWRYLNFTKFTSLLDKKALYFCRADLLGDPFEGSYPKSTVEAREQHFKEMGFQGALSDKLKALSRYSRMQMYINCWHMNPIESDAMWKLYSSNEQAKEGIAIRTTFKKLKDCFNSTEDRIFIGQISYVDYDNTPWMSAICDLDTGEKRAAPFYGGGFPAVLHKRNSFEHEREIRCLFWQPHIRNGEVVLHCQDIPCGCNIQANLNCLIDAVYIAPHAGNWLKELTTNIIQKHGFSFEVIHSILSDSPMF